jgi:hypothetical protein
VTAPIPSGPPSPEERHHNLALEMELHVEMEHFATAALRRECRARWLAAFEQEVRGEAARALESEAAELRECAMTYEPDYPGRPRQTMLREVSILERVAKRLRPDTGRGEERE